MLPTCSVDLNQCCRCDECLMPDRGGDLTEVVCTGGHAVLDAGRWLHDAKWCLRCLVVRTYHPLQIIALPSSLPPSSSSTPSVHVWCEEFRLAVAQPHPQSQVHVNCSLECHIQAELQFSRNSVLLQDRRLVHESCACQQHHILQVPLQCLQRRHGRWGATR